MTAEAALKILPALGFIRRSGASAPLKVSLINNLPGSDLLEIKPLFRRLPPLANAADTVSFPGSDRGLPVRWPGSALFFGLFGRWLRCAAGVLPF
jgi:hypothetical protein